jgi:hypothetical protein
MFAHVHTNSLSLSPSLSLSLTHTHTHTHTRTISHSLFLRNSRATKEHKLLLLPPVVFFFQFLMLIFDEDLQKNSLHLLTPDDNNNKERGRRSHSTSFGTSEKDRMWGDRPRFESGILTEPWSKKQDASFSPFLERAFLNWVLIFR